MDAPEALKTWQQVEHLRDEAAALVRVLAESTTELRKASALRKASNGELAYKNERLHKINTVLDNFTYTVSHDLSSFWW